MGVVVNLDAITWFQKAQRLSFVDEQDVQQNQGEQEMTPQEALQYNVDAAQRELDRRHAEGEDVSGLRVCERTAVIKMTDARLARELSDIALGEFWSDKAVRAAADRLRELRSFGVEVPYVDGTRLDAAVTACEKALQGDAQVHHRLQDAAVVLMLSAASEWESRPVDERLWSETRPMAEIAVARDEDWRSAMARYDYTEMYLRGYMGLLDDETAIVRDGEALWLMQGGDGRVVLAHADVVDGKVQTRAGRDDVMGLPVEAIHARERRLAKLAEEFLAVPAGGPAVPPTWDLMKIASANEQQADAMKMVESLAERRGAQVSAWEQSAAKEWKLATATEGRRFFRVGVSTGGVVNVNGDPYTPHERRLNVTLGALQESWEHAVAMTVELAASIKMDVVGADLPADQASAWRRLSEEENRLAGYLTSYEHGTALLDAEGATAWYLQEQDGATVLIHAAVRAGRVDDVGASRFEAVEMGADVESLEGYTTKVKSTADSWVIDPNLVSTMKVGDNEQAHSLSGPR